MSRAVHPGLVRLRLHRHNRFGGPGRSVDEVGAEVSPREGWRLAPTAVLKSPRFLFLRRLACLDRHDLAGSAGFSITGRRTGTWREPRSGAA